MNHLPPQFRITDVQNMSDIGCREIAALQNLYDYVTGYNKNGEDDLRFVELFFIQEPLLNLYQPSNSIEEKNKIRKNIEIGRICKCINEKNEIIGFILVFDTFQFSQYGKILNIHFSNFFKYRWSLVNDLEKLDEVFTFMPIMVVHPAFQKRGIGSNLLESVERYYKKMSDRKKPMIIATIINENQRYAMKALYGAGYLFVDYQLDKANLLWFRSVKVLNERKFTRAMNHKLLPQAFKITIPIQLAIATKKVNHFIGRINGAKVLWSSFFQYDYPILAKVFNMDSHYSAYYSPILNTIDDDHNYQETISTLKEVLIYLEHKNLKDQKEPLASITDGLKKEGFELMLINDQLKNHQVQDYFPNAIALNIKTLALNDLAVITALKIGDPLSAQDSKEWGETLFQRSKIKTPQTEEEFSVMEKWDKWVRWRNFSPEEVDLLLRSATNAPLSKLTKLKTSNEYERVNQLKQRKKMSEMERHSWGKWIELHQKFYKADCHEINPADVWCHCVIPLTVNKESVMGLMFTFSYQKKQQKEDKKLLGELAFIISNTFAKHMLLITERLTGKVNGENLLKYAISTVMNRNLSHNVGSHVLSKLSSAKMLEKYLNVADFEDGLRQIAAFNSYLQSRMDFLADISTSEPVSAFSRKLEEDLIHRFNSEEIIRKLISGSELEQVIVKLVREKPLDQEKDLAVQIPNGELGCHSFFIILENIIRNSAKHESARIKQRLEITVKAELASRENENHHLRERGYFLTIYDNIDREYDEPLEEPELVKKLNKVINTRLIEDWHRIRPFGWGMAEMKIAAAYLRRKLPSKYLDLLPSAQDIPILQAVAVPASRYPDKYYLGFKIYLKKPREILLIESEEQLKHLQFPPAWKNEGIKLVTVNELKINAPYIHSHNITLLFDQINRKKIESTKIFPLRWLIVYKKSEREEIYQAFHQNMGEAITLVWQKWIQSLVSRKLKNQDYVLLIPNEKPIDLDEYVDKKIALYDKHGHSLSQYPELAQKLVFYEKYSAINSIGKVLGHIESEPPMHRKRIEFELIEAALTEVIILDERIQQILSGANQMDALFNLFSSLEISGVFIPEVHELMLFKKAFGDSDLETLNQWLNAVFSRQKIDFIVLHIGLVEKMIGKTKVEEINGFVNRFIRSKYPEVEIVFITGRGKPHKLPQGTLYVTYSTLAKYIVEEPSKYHLTRVLYSAREILDQYEV